MKDGGLEGRIFLRYPEEPVNGKHRNAYMIKGEVKGLVPIIFVDENGEPHEEHTNDLLWYKNILNHREYSLKE